MKKIADEAYDKPEMALVKMAQLLIEIEKKHQEGRKVSCQLLVREEYTEDGKEQVERSMCSFSISKEAIVEMAFYACSNVIPKPPDSETATDADWARLSQIYGYAFMKWCKHFWEHEKP